MKLKSFCKKKFLFLIITFSVSCLSHTENQRKFSIEDTTSIIQKTLSDKKLEAELLKDFGNQSLTLVVGYAIEPTQQFWFAGKPVTIASVPGDVYQIHEQHPKELYVSVPEVKFHSTDSATVSLIFHAGNATSLFVLKNQNGIWTVKRRQDGKF